MKMFKGNKSKVRGNASKNMSIDSSTNCLNLKKG